MTQTTPPPPPEPSDRKEIDRLKEEYGMTGPKSPSGKLVTMGVEFAGIVVVAILLGLWLDSRFGTKPWILLGLMLVGMVGGMVRLIRGAMKNTE